MKRAKLVERLENEMLRPIPLPPGERVPLPVAIELIHELIEVLLAVVLEDEEARFAGGAEVTSHTPIRYPLRVIDGARSA